MKLGNPPDKYSRDSEVARNAALVREDLRNRKSDQHVDLPIGTFVILRSPNGAKWKIQVSNAGALSAAAV